MELENGPALSSQPQKQFFSANTVGYLVFLMSQVPISSSRKLGFAAELEFGHTPRFPVNRSVLATERRDRGGIAYGRRVT
jgi:hypothetical protein